MIMKSETLYIPTIYKLFQYFNINEKSQCIKHCDVYYVNYKKVVVYGLTSKNIARKIEKNKISQTGKKFRAQVI